MENKLYAEGYTQNRELSWLNFNERILEEACDTTVPLFERLNFIAIFTSNLDEFFQVRVGGLLNDEMDINEKIDVRSGMDASDQLEAIHIRIGELIKKRDRILKIILSELRCEGVKILGQEELRDDEKVFLAKYYLDEIKPLLNPIISQSPEDVPELSVGSVCIIARLEADNTSKFGIIEIPSELNATIPLEPVMAYGKELRVCLSKDVISWSLEDVFYPFKVAEYAAIRINRNADVELDDTAKNKIREMKRLIKRRSVSDPDTVYIEGDIGNRLRNYILDAIKLDYKQAFSTYAVSMNYVGEVGKLLPVNIKDKVCYEPFEPIDQLLLEYKSLMDTLRVRDIVSIYPYDSMQAFLTLLKEASCSNKVEEIRITIYRLASDPRIVDYLINAAQNGIVVKVLMELRARFDEASNVDWAEKLEEAGCKVFFGNDNYKVHTKLFQVVAREGDDVVYYTQFGTGNYNEKTAKLYTDISLITVNQRLGRDANAFFNDIFSGTTGVYDYLLTSPRSMQHDITAMIREEAAKGSDGRIFIKCNSITDESIIEELMLASCAGCRIRMVVRGICCILPGIKGYTENIEVVSVVGRFLEHSRVYIFGEGKSERMYISSADFMTRNMLKRIEVACPIYDKNVKERIRNIVHLNFADNVKGRRMRPDGRYELNNTKSLKIDSQRELMKHRM